MEEMEMGKGKETKSARGNQNKDSQGYIHRLVHGKRKRFDRKGKVPSQLNKLINKTLLKKLFYNIIICIWKPAQSQQTL